MNKRIKKKKAKQAELERQKQAETVRLKVIATWNENDAFDELARHLEMVTKPAIEVATKIFEKTALAFNEFFIKRNR